MEVKKLLQTANAFSRELLTVSPAPEELYIAGSDSLEKFMTLPRVAIVGSRKVSAYGKQVTVRLAGELAKRGVVIISGLALGVDALAHRAALDAGGLTIAVLPCGLDRIYPANHYRLAQDIVAHGGALVSEYPEHVETYKVNFIARNRLVSGLSQAVLITEAAERSGTLHTADFALQQGKEVLAVPGAITSPTSKGTNNLIKSGALMVTDLIDVLQALGLDTGTGALRQQRGSNEHEQRLLDLINGGLHDGAELLTASQMEVSLFNQTLTMLEITCKIRALGNNQWGVY